MLRRWTSDYHVAWKPSLTFSMRRLRLLEVLEGRVDPVAMVDDPDTVGVALISSDLRVRVKRHGLQVSSGPNGLEPQLLLPAVEVIFEVMEPQDPVLSKVGTLLTTRIDEVYHEATARFAAGLAAGVDISGYRPVDASGLMDLDSLQHSVQVEWGVVSRDELLGRLKLPMVGRINTLRGAGHSHPQLPTTLADEIPPVSLFVEVVHTRKQGGQISGSQDVIDLGSRLDEAAATIMTALYKGTWQEGEQLELAEA